MSISLWSFIVYTNNDILLRRAVIEKLAVSWHPGLSAGIGAAVGAGMGYLGAKDKKKGEMIKDIVLEESTKQQLSDQKIAELLSQRGIKIARRTVAKYRKELNILPSNLRRT